MAWNELSVRVGNGNHRFVEVVVRHPSCAPQCSGAGHIAALCRGVGSVLWHVISL